VARAAATVKVAGTAYLAAEAIRTAANIKVGKVAATVTDGTGRPAMAAAVAAGAIGRKATEARLRAELATSCRAAATTAVRPA